MIRVAVPQIFENMEEATVGKWLVAEGQTVGAEQPLCELITEKVTLELPSPGAGVVRRLVVPEKAVVPAHFVVALLGDEIEAMIDIDAENAYLRESPAPMASDVAPVEMPQIEVPAAASGTGRVRATPAARRAAKDGGVSIDDVAAKFPGKVVGEDDVRAFLSA